jgi:hypothetical protein
MAVKADWIFDMCSQMCLIALGTSIQETYTDTTQTFIPLQRALYILLASEIDIILLLEKVKEQKGI